jgi:hypothetical protein
LLYLSILFVKNLRSICQCVSREWVRCFVVRKKNQTKQTNSQMCNKRRQRALSLNERLWSTLLHMKMASEEARYRRQSRFCVMIVVGEFFCLTRLNHKRKYRQSISCCLVTHCYKNQSTIGLVKSLVCFISSLFSHHTFRYVESGNTRQIKQEKVV